MKIFHLYETTDFEMVLRQWGDNTVFDRAKKESDLMKFDNEASRYRQPHEWLYRGQIIDDIQIDALMNGESITIHPDGIFSSWSPDSDIAHTFAKYADSGDGAIVIQMQNLTTFFDFDMYGDELRANGGFPSVDDYSLHDPIREQEVIVKNPSTITISPSNVLEMFYYDDNGDQKHWMPQ